MIETQLTMSPAQQFEKMFAPDITVKWNNDFKVFIILSNNAIGNVWMKRYTGGIITKLGKSIPPSLITNVIKGIQNLGMCIEYDLENCPLTNLIP